ncbi:MAG TPA: ATP-binding cassette domain-containing protein [Chryseolinea sp.]
MISIKGIDVVKSGVKLFTDFSWEVASNENWLIAGRNGSGKTLLLEALAGKTHFAKGEIQYDFVVSDTWQERYEEKRRFISYIPAHALHTYLNGNQDLFYQQRYYDIGDDKVPTVRDLMGAATAGLPAMEIPESLSIDHLLGVKITRLSNGQLKKFLLIKSFLKGIPKLLLLDNPFEGLDHGSREDLCGFIDFIVERYAVQVILVDHHHHLPACINRTLTLENFRIKTAGIFAPDAAAEDKITPLAKPAHVNSHEEVIGIRNLTLKYGDLSLFENFNLRVNKGQRWALVGRNGSGKTTLFSLIFADHPHAYAQDIRLFGRKRGTGESIWDIKRRINYLGPEQVSYLNPKGVLMTAAEYIHDVNKFLDQTVLGEMVKYFDAAAVMKKQVRHLSSGELQLVVVMSCFLSDRELLLLDEPFQFLDDIQKQRLTKYLLQHLKAETTLVLITHYEHDIRQWTDQKVEI